jgi:hypothetical protein
MPQAILRSSLRQSSGQDWTNPSKGSGHAFLNRPEASDIQRACGPICPWELLLFKTPTRVSYFPGNFLSDLVVKKVLFFTSKISFWK